MFLKDITITHLRGIQNFTLSNLPQIVLLGGQNNCGKTTVLEAVSLLADQRSVRGFLEINRLRGLPMPTMEALLNGFAAESGTEIFDIHGTTEKGLGLQTVGSDRPRASYNISATSPKSPRVTFSEKEDQPLENLKTEPGLLVHEPDTFDVLLPGEDPNTKEFVVTFQRTPVEGHASYFRDSVATPVDNTPGRWKITEGAWGSSHETPVPEEMKTPWDCMFISASGIEVVEDRLLGHLFRLGEDMRLVRLLQRIDPRIVRLGHVQNETLVTIKGHKRPFPLPALGMGSLQIIRIFTYAALSRNGIIAIDEIENGLHYTSCHVLWKELLRLAKKNNIQLFITTHREDVLSSFAEVYEEMEDAPSAAYFNLIRDPETDDLEAYRFTPDALLNAIEIGQEVR